MSADLLVALALSALTAIATLVLVSLGLAVIFGVMNVINLAHGEFLVLGAYTLLVVERIGWPWWAGVLAAPLVVAAIALVVERLIIRFLYGRLVETMLATWGLSLVLVQLMVIIFGSGTRGTASPLGSLQIGSYTVSDYSLVLIVLAVTLPIGLYLIFTRTRYGILARAVAQNPSMAAALGINTEAIRAATFMLGAGFAGIAGALVGSVVTVVPTMGQAFIASAFMTVIVGGPGVITGTISAATLLGATQSLVSFWQSAVIGQAALLLVAVLLLRLRPEGLSGRWKHQL